MTRFELVSSSNTIPARWDSVRSREHGFQDDSAVVAALGGLMAWLQTLTLD